MKNRIKSFAAASLLALGVAASAPASAGTIQLGFILDESGSIGAPSWTTIVNGLSSAINLIPVGGPDTYEVSVVKFSTSATASISNFLVSDAGQRTALSGLISGLSFGGGVTNFAAAFSTMQTVLGNTILGASKSYVNFATDGQQNQGGTGVAQRNALIASGVDNISIEGIGNGVDAADLQNNFCYPSPCDTTNPYDFPAKGFYIGVANAQGYADAIGLKIQTVTGQVPEPATLALIGVGLLGLGFSRRRTAAAA